MGCTLSHLKVVNLAKQRGLSSYFVFEDDVVLTENFQEKFERAMAGLPKNWRLVYAGGDNQKPTAELANNGYVRGTARTLTTHAFGAHYRAYDDLIRVLKQHEKVDLNISELHKGGDCWIMEPRLAGQRAGWSYILNKPVQNEHKFFQV
jgi:GR25 family glycosyltransferase involved in LPS biosynthesis